jgi:hypothetical protein
LRLAGGVEVTLRLSEKRRPSCKDGMSSLVEAASRLWDWDETEDGDIAAASMSVPAPTPYQPTGRRVGGTCCQDSALPSAPKPCSADQNLQERHRGSKESAFEEEAPARLWWWGGGDEPAHLHGELGT